MSELTDKLRSYDPTSGYSRWMREAADRIEELENPWISVDERLPEEYGAYLVLRVENPFPTSRLFNGIDFVTTSTVTNWQPLPPPPNREVNEK